MNEPIKTAMILAAGLGRRMQARAADPPKPLTEIAGQSLLARMMARLEAAGIDKIIINMHHKAEAIEAFAAQYDGRAQIVLSDERAALLETGGGVKKALPLLGDAPFLVANGDILWREETPQLPRLMAAFEPQKMAALLLLAARATATGYDGAGDFHLLEDGRLKRKSDAPAPFIFAGVQILTPSAFADAPEGAFSLNRIYDRAAARQALFGHVLDGAWMHVGTKQGRAAADKIMQSPANPQPIHRW